MYFIILNTSDESKDGRLEYALVPVKRLFGRYGTVSVSWSIMEVNSTDDLDPVSGTLTFNPGEGEKVIEILTVADEVSFTFIFFEK